MFGQQEGLPPWKLSRFRQRMAELGEPLDEQAMRRVKIAHAQSSMLTFTRERDAKPYMEMWAGLMTEAAEKGDRAATRFFQLNMSNDEDAMRKLQRAFLNDGFLMNFEETAQFFGPVLSCHNIGGENQYLAALTLNLRNPAWAGKEYSVVDLTAMVELAISYMNAYRHGEIDANASLALETHDMEGSYADARKKFEAVRGLAATDVLGLSASVARMREAGVPEEGQARAAAGLGSNACAARVVEKYFEEDEQAHLLRILNAAVRTGLVRVFTRFQGLPEGVKTLACLAFGEMNMTLAQSMWGAARANLSGDETPALRYIDSVGWMLGSGTGVSIPNRLGYILSADEKDVALCSRLALSQALLAGGVTLSESELRTLEWVSSTEFVEKSQLPAILGVWRVLSGFMEYLPTRW